MFTIDLLVLTDSMAGSEVVPCISAGRPWQNRRETGKKVEERSCNDYGVVERDVPGDARHG